MQNQKQTEITKLTVTHKQQKNKPPYHVVSQCFNVYVLLKGRDIDKKEMRTQLKINSRSVYGPLGTHTHRRHTCTSDTAICKSN